MKISEIINEGVIPKSKPLDYEIVVDGSSVGTKPFQIGNTFLTVEFNIGPQSVVSAFAQLLKPQAMSGRQVLAGDLAFMTGPDPDSMSDEKNTGAAVADAARIFRAVAYIANDIVGKKRSLLPIITFWARSGENRDALYERLAREFTVSWNNWGYSRLNPAVVLGTNPPNSTWMWAHRGVFNSWTGDSAEISKYLYDAPTPVLETDNRVRIPIVYHGNQGGIHGELHAPMWWTESKQDAIEYATQGGADGWLYTARLSCRNPYVVSKREETNTVLNRIEDLKRSGYDCVHDPSVGDWIPFYSKNIHIVDKSEYVEP